jgi:hypothetical protein
MEVAEDGLQPMDASQEREETVSVTTIQPISLENDTAVNTLTEGVTEDTINAEPIEEEATPLPPLVVVTEMPEAPVEVDVEIQTTTVMSPVSPVQAPAESESSGEEFTTTTTSTTPAPIQAPTTLPPVLTTTINVLSVPISSNETASQEHESGVGVNVNPSPVVEAADESVPNSSLPVSSESDSQSSQVQSSSADEENNELN